MRPFSFMRVLVLRAPVHAKPRLADAQLHSRTLIGPDIFSSARCVTSISMWCCTNHAAILRKVSRSSAVLHSFPLLPCRLRRWAVRTCCHGQCELRQGLEVCDVALHWLAQCWPQLSYRRYVLLGEPRAGARYRGGGGLNPGSTQVRTLGLDQRGGGRISTSRTWVQPRFNPGSTQIKPSLNPRSTQVQPRFSDPGSTQVL